MPTIPSSNKCRELGCQNTKTYRSAFCSAHGGARTETQKANGKLYNQKAWERIRARQLSTNPLCAKCLIEGKITAAQHVDHVFPHRRDAVKFKLNLFQSLCAACHTLKGQDEAKGIYNHYKGDKVEVYTDDDYVRLVGMTY